METLFNSANQLLLILGTIATGTVGVYASTHGAKKLTSLRSSLDNALVKRGLAGLFSVLAVVLISFLSGEPIKPENLQELMVKLIEFGAMWFASHKVHEAVKKG